MTEITATEVFTFVNNVFSDENSSDDLRELLRILVNDSDEDDPKDIVHKFSKVILYYQTYCIEKIHRKMSKEHSDAVNALHNASIIAQGGH